MPSPKVALKRTYPRLDGQGLVVETAMGPKGSFVVRGAAAAALAAGGNKSHAQQAAREENELMRSGVGLPSPLTRCARRRCLRPASAWAANVTVCPIPVGRMYESLKADGAVVEKVFDGKGSMIVRSADRAALAELAASLTATDAQDSTAAGQVGEVMTDRYAKARGQWRPAANPVREHGDDEATWSEASSMKTVPSQPLTPHNAVGRRVSISHLPAMKALEGKTGSVIASSSEPGRVVLLDDTSEKLNITVKHLRLLDDGDNGTERCSSDAASNAVITLAAMCHILAFSHSALRATHSLLYAQVVDIHSELPPFFD